MQIFVEIERARLTKQLAKLKEEEGKIDEAAEILQEVAVVSLSVSRCLCLSLVLAENMTFFIHDMQGCSVIPEVLACASWPT